MTARWQKLGLLYSLPDEGLHPKLLSHAANPLPVHIYDDVYRIFFCSRDRENRSSIGGVDINIITRDVVRQYHQPFFEFGPPGSFYADGVSIGNCYTANGTKYIFFMGWQSPKDSHFRGDIGRILMRPDLSLELDQDWPVMGTDSTDPISLSYPWVAGDSANGFHMWYGSTTTWDAGNGEMLHVLNHASSDDGQIWHRKGQVVPHHLGVAQAFSRPTIARSPAGQWQMWFSYRGGAGTKYRIGHAVSSNRKTWQLSLANVGIDVSSTGWDSEMIEYPFVFDHKDKRYMLYNGNNYGKSGFGLAVSSHD